MQKFTNIEKRFIEGYFAVIKTARSTRDVSMASIYKRAGVNKQSVYHNFSDMDAVQIRIEEYLDGDIYHEIEEYIYSGRKQLVLFFSQEILPMIYANREKLKIMYSTKAGAYWSVYLQEKYLPLMQHYFYNPATDSPTVSDFSCGLALREMIAIIAEWLVSKKRESLLDFQKNFASYLSTSATELLSKAV